MQHPRAKNYKVLGHLARGPFRQAVQVCDRVSFLIEFAQKKIFMLHSIDKFPFVSV